MDTFVGHSLIDPVGFGPLPDGHTLLLVLYRIRTAIAGWHISLSTRHVLHSIQDPVPDHFVSWQSSAPSCSIDSYPKITHRLLFRPVRITHRFSCLAHRFLRTWRRRFAHLLQERFTHSVHGRKIHLHLALKTFAPITPISFELSHRSVVKIGQIVKRIVAGLA